MVGIGRQLKFLFERVWYYLAGLVIAGVVFYYSSGWVAWLFSLIFIACLFWILVEVGRFIHWFFMIQPLEKKMWGVIKEQIKGTSEKSGG